MLCTLIGAIILSINIQVGLNDIGDASSSLRRSISSFFLIWVAKSLFWCLPSGFLSLFATWETHCSLDSCRQLSSLQPESGCETCNPGCRNSRRLCRWPKKNSSKLKTSTHDFRETWRYFWSHLSERHDNMMAVLVNTSLPSHVSKIGEKIFDAYRGHFFPIIILNSL